MPSYSTDLVESGIHQLSPGSGEEQNAYLNTMSFLQREQSGHPINSNAYQDFADLSLSWSSQILPKS